MKILQEQKDNNRTEIVKSGEIWMPVINYPDYQVSNLGSVKSLERKVKKGKFEKIQYERILKPAKSKHGYLFVVLTNIDGRKIKKVHHLVAGSFLGYISNGIQDLVINHINFIRDDNRVENLEITTTRINSNLKHVKSSSIYTGVAWDKYSNKWKASIFINKKSKHLGLFIIEYDAHLAYEEALNNHLKQY